MMRKNFQRLVALILAVTFVFGGGAISAAATGNDGAEAKNNQSSVADKDLQSITELLNAITYDEYAKKIENEQPAKNEIVINAVNDIYVDKSDCLATEADGQREDKAYKTEYEGVECLYTPSDGLVSWKVNIPETAKYSIKIEYYPVVGKPTAIERIFKIDDMVPFREARYLTINKIMSNKYADCSIGTAGGESVDSLIKAAEEIGLVAKADPDKSGNVLVACPTYWTEAIAKFCNDRDIRFFRTDTENNELRPDAEQTPAWSEYTMRDQSGYYIDTFEFLLEKGDRVLTLEGRNEAMAIKSITLIQTETFPTYDEYFAEVSKYENNAKDGVQIECEYTGATSSKTIYPIEDRSDAATSPSDTSRIVLNTVGGEKWQTAGQSVSYSFKVSESGMYDIISRFRQNVLDGMYVCRSLEVYSTGLKEGDEGYYNGTPFREAQTLRYNYGTAWQTTKLENGDVDKNDDNKTYALYFRKDVTYTITFNVTLGSMGNIVREVESILNAANEDYLAILKLTGTAPDQYNDYGFARIMPDTLIDMIIQSRRLDNSDNKGKANYKPGLVEQLTAMAGQKSSNVGTLQKVANLLNKMGTNEDEIAKNLENLKTYVGTLGTFLSDAKTQPLQLDYILIRPADSDEKMPQGAANFWQALCHEIASFFMSFFRDYNSMGSLDKEAENNGIQVWLADGRDQAQVIRSLINSDFSPNQEIGGIPVDLKLVAGGTLLPSILAGSGPDVYLGLGQGDVINYAIRSALINIEDMADFESFTTDNFTPAAMMVLGIEDADDIMHYYGLPEKQSFSMMFIRDDVLARLHIDIPKTWDDILAAVPTLQQEKMDIGLTTDFQIYLYQNYGDLFADNGMRINLDSTLGLSSFEYMCNLFTQYSFPYTYNAANRFRTGEMPIIISDYTGMYNQLKVFATEIEGMWEFLPMPGIEQEDGTINNVSISSVSAVVLVSGCSNKDNSWKFMKWYTGADCQASFTDEMVAIMGPSAKHPTANKNALKSMPWTTDEYKQVAAQFNNLAAVPNYPGAYIIGRYTGFAFLSAYNDKANPSDAIMAYINTINKEITRKRKEFKLETLEIGENLAQKRLRQVIEILEKIKSNSDYKSEYDSIISLANAAVLSEDQAALNNAAEKLKEVQEAIDSGEAKYKEEIIKVMGYDVTDVTLTDTQKGKIRKCYYYEAYKKVNEMSSLIHFAAEYMEDAADAISTY